MMTFIFIIYTLFLILFITHAAHAQYLPTDWQSTDAAGRGNATTAWTNTRSPWIPPHRLPPFQLVPFTLAKRCESCLIFIRQLFFHNDIAIVFNHVFCMSIQQLAVPKSRRKSDRFHISLLRQNALQNETSLRNHQSCKDPIHVFLLVRIKLLLTARN